MTTMTSQLAQQITVDQNLVYELETARRELKGGPKKDNPYYLTPVQRKFAEFVPNTNFQKVKEIETGEIYKTRAWKKDRAPIYEKQDELNRRSIRYNLHRKVKTKWLVSRKGDYTTTLKVEYKPSQSKHWFELVVCNDRTHEVVERYQEFTSIEAIHKFINDTKAQCISH